MNLNQRSQQAYDDSVAWFGDALPNDLGHQALGLGGETGELQNLIKKVERGDTDVEDVLGAIVEELTDVLEYTFGIAGFLERHYGIDLEQEYDHKRRHNQRRFGEGARASRDGIRQAGLGPNEGRRGGVRSPDLPGEANPG